MNALWSKRGRGVQFKEGSNSTFKTTFTGTRLLSYVYLILLTLYMLSSTHGARDERVKRARFKVTKLANKRNRFSFTTGFVLTPK